MHRLRYRLLRLSERLFAYINGEAPGKHYYNKGYQDGITQAKKDYRQTFLQVKEEVRRHRERTKAQDNTLRAAVFVRAKHRCEYCGQKSAKLTVDHFIPISKGGRSAMDNLVSSCEPCNKRKGNMMGEDFKKLLHSARSPMKP